MQNLLDLKFYRDNEKNMGYLLISKSPSFWTNPKDYLEFMYIFYVCVLRNNLMQAAMFIHRTTTVNQLKLWN